jgi:hypothetical protein
VTEFPTIKRWIVSKLNRQGLGSTVMRVARVILGATILLSILWANIPTAVLASGPICHLACCAGRAPHAVGSCMNGSCHAFLTGRPKTSKTHVQFPVHESEQLCGLRRRTSQNPLVSLRGSTALTLLASSDLSRGSRAPDAASMSMSTLGKPCQLDCGTGTFSSSQSRPRDSGAISYADKPRPPPTARHEHSSFSRAKALDALCRRSRPRGPPIFSS